MTFSTCDFTERSKVGIFFGLILKDESGAFVSSLPKVAVYLGVVI